MIKNEEYPESIVIPVDKKLMESDPYYPKSKPRNLKAYRKWLIELAKKIIGIS